MEIHKKYIDNLQIYQEKIWPFLHKNDYEEWTLLYHDVLDVIKDLQDIKPRHLVGAMYFIITNDKDYTEQELEDAYRFLRVYSKYEDISLFAYMVVNLLMKKEDTVNNDYLIQLREFLKEKGYQTLLTDTKHFTKERMQVLLDQDVNRTEISKVEQWFFEGHLYLRDDADYLAYTTLQVVPYAYHLFIFLMDKLLHHSVNRENIALLEIFVKVFKTVHDPSLIEQTIDLQSPSDVREYCFALSSIAMFYVEEEQYEKAIGYYEELFEIDEDNVFHAKEYSLRAYMMNGSYDEYSNILEKLDNQSVYKRLLILYRKIQLMEEDTETYMHDLVKDYGYLLRILLSQRDEEVEKLPEIEEDFIREYGLLFLENERILDYIQTFIKQHNYTA